MSTCLIQCRLRHGVVYQDNRNICVICLLDSRSQRVGVCCGQDDRVKALDNGVLDHLHLLLYIGLLLRSLELEVDALFLCERLSTILHASPECVRLCLNDVRDLYLIIAAGARAAARAASAAAGCQTHHHCSCHYHCHRSLEFHFCCSSQFVDSFFFLLFLPIRGNDSVNANSLTSLLQPCCG